MQLSSTSVQRHHGRLSGMQQQRGRPLLPLRPTTLPMGRVGPHACTRGQQKRGNVLKARVAMPELAHPRTIPEPAKQPQLQPHLQQHPQEPIHHAAAPAPADDFQPITAMWGRLAASVPGQVALFDPHRSPPLSVTYGELSQLILDFAAGLRAQGLAQGDRVCLFAESSSRWIVADQGILMNGAADAVRGSSSPAEELGFILQHSEATGLVLQDGAALVKLLPAVRDAVRAGQAVRFVTLLWDTDAAPAAAATAAPAAAAPAAANGSSRSSSNGSNGNDAASSAAASASAAAAELESLGVVVTSYAQVLAAGQQARAAASSSSPPTSAFAPPVPVGRSDLATLCYTSGTTGHPKGVMLTHGNLAYQVDNLDYFLPVSAGDSTLSLLPPWHIYQRSVAYYLFSRGAREVFTSLRHFRDDLTAHPPDHFVCVPLVLDTLFNKVMAKLSSEATGLKGVIVSALMSASYAFITARRVASGTSLAHALTAPSVGQRAAALLSVALLAPLYALAQKLVFSKVRAALGIRRTIISGGGSLAAHLDLFYEAVGLPLLNGWGLTETSPVLACRRPGSNVRGSVGLPTPGTQVRVVHPATHAPLPDGQQGLLLAAGPGVMSGYWRDTAATRKAFVDGWYDTGDLGWRAPGGVPGSAMAGHIVLTGRSKDTLVLLSGKNIEPQPIEDALCRSPFIKHVMLVGQDKRELGALVFPDEEHLALTGAASGSGSGSSSSSSRGGDGSGGSATSASDGKLEALLFGEVSRLNKQRPDYHPEDHIAHVQVVRAPLSVEGGTLTRTLKPRRPAISDAYAAELARLLGRLRG